VVPTASPPQPPDPYLDPDTGALRNLVGARDQAGLKAAEDDLTVARLVELLEHPPTPTGDLVELQAIHKQLFQDVYDWAGQLRTGESREDIPGAEPFAPRALLDVAIANTFGQLQEANMLCGLGSEQFIEAIAFHYDQVNYLHPFREGNGRTQRVFFTRVARHAGWHLDWRPIHGRVNDNACRIAAEQRDLVPLQAMFDQIVVPAPGAPPTGAAPGRRGWPVGWDHSIFAFRAAPPE
jgi:cell filamentation protein